MWRSVSAALDKTQRYRFFLVVLVSLANVLGELAALAMIYVLSRAIFAPRGIGAAGPVTRLISLRPAQDMLPYLFVAIIFVFFIKLCLNVATSRFRARYIHIQHAIFSERLMARYIDKGWLFFLKNNVSVLSHHVVIECAQLAATVLSETITLVIESVTILAICAALFLVSPRAMLAVAIFAIVTIAVFRKFLTPWIRKMGTRNRNARLRTAEIVDVTLRSAKEVILYDRSRYFLGRLGAVLTAQAESEIRALMLRDIPRPVLELFGISALIAAVSVEIWHGAPMASAALVMAVFGAGGIRLIGSVSRLASSASTINGLQAMVEGLTPDLAVSAETCASAPAISDRLLFRDRIELRHVAFRHEGAIRHALDDVSLTINHGESIAIAGPTGAGKSTLVDLLLGLLKPQTGEILIDGRVLSPDILREWQANVGYVPQSPSLINDTVTRNIAFGIADDAIDMDRVREAARVANLDRVIANELPHAYETLIGDRGISLSGGQQQRMAIARAIYRQPELIVLDEATSALDHATETVVSDAIANLRQKRTIIIVAHRLSTIRNCDRIMVLRDGRLVQTGTFDALLAEGGTFRNQFETAQPSKGS